MHILRFNDAGRDYRLHFHFQGGGREQTSSQVKQLRLGCITIDCICFTRSGSDLREKTGPESDLRLFSFGMKVNMYISCIYLYFSSCGKKNIERKG